MDCQASWCSAVHERCCRPHKTVWPIVIVSPKCPKWYGTPLPLTWKKQVASTGPLPTDLFTKPSKPAKTCCCIVISFSHHCLLAYSLHTADQVFLLRNIVWLHTANHVFLLEPSMDPAILQQAVGRAHRMGQTRPVHVTRLIMHSTVEVTPHPSPLTPCMLCFYPHTQPALCLSPPSWGPTYVLSASAQQVSPDRYCLHNFVQQMLPNKPRLLCLSAVMPQSSLYNSQHTSPCNLAWSHGCCQGTAYDIQHMTSVAKGLR